MWKFIHRCTLIALKINLINGGGLLVTILVCILSLLFTTDSLAGTIDPNTPDIKYIEYGKDFHCIGKVLGKMKNGLDFNEIGRAHV